jgi:hypothetical protein
LFSFNLYAQNHDFTYCYDCSAPSKKALAESMVNYPGTKLITIINRSNRNLTTFKVIRTVEPGINTVDAMEQPTPEGLSNLINNIYHMMDDLKSETSTPIDVTLLPGYGNPNFPTTAHNLVNNNLAQQWLINGTSDYLSSIGNGTTLDTSGTFLTGIIVRLVNLVGQAELINVQYTIEFAEGSIVVIQIDSLSIDGNSLNAIVNVVQKPNSMRDSEGNLIPDTAEGLSNSSYYFSSPSNIAYWGSLISRLTSYMTGFGQVCTWTSEFHVQCESQ